MKNLKYVAFSLVVLIGVMGEELVAMSRGSINIEERKNALVSALDETFASPPGEEDPMVAALKRSHDKVSDLSAAARFLSNPVVTRENIEAASEYTNNPYVTPQDKFKIWHTLYEKTSALGPFMINRERYLFEQTLPRDIVGLHNYIITHESILLGLLVANKALPRTRFISRRGKHYSPKLKRKLKAELASVTKARLLAEAEIDRRYEVAHSTSHSASQREPADSPVGPSLNKATAKTFHGFTKSSKSLDSN
jgi:hypothetical protein